MEIQKGDVFIFLNKRQTHLKALEWEGDGFSLYYKRLEEGTFELPAGLMEGTHSSITAKHLSMILQGRLFEESVFSKAIHWYDVILMDHRVNIFDVAI